MDELTEDYWLNLGATITDDEYVSGLSREMLDELFELAKQHGPEEAAKILKQMMLAS